MKSLLLALLLVPSIASATLFEDFAKHFADEIVFKRPPTLCKVDMKDKDEPIALCFMVGFKSKGQRPFQLVHRDGVIERIMTPPDADYPTGEIDPESFMRASTI